VGRPCGIPCPPIVQNRRHSAQNPSVAHSAPRRSDGFSSLRRSLSLLQNVPSVRELSSRAIKRRRPRRQPQSVHGQRAKDYEIFHNRLNLLNFSVNSSFSSVRNRLRNPPQRLFLPFMHALESPVSTPQKYSRLSRLGRIWRASRGMTAENETY